MVFTMSYSNADLRKGVLMASVDYTNENRQRLMAFFRSGSKAPEDIGRLGVEVEHIIIGDDGDAISYEPTDAHKGVRDVLAYLTTWYPQQSFNDHGDLLGLLGDEGSVTLEPAAQLELSAAPYDSIAQVRRAYRNFRERVDTFLAADGAHVEAWGYHPTHRAQDLVLIPKKRYDFMDSYFQSIGSNGDRMMRGSASTQVSVDFVDEADAVRKMRVAGALAPILAAIADNTPMFEGEPNHVPIRRLSLWREVDNLRCGTIPHLFEERFGFGTYADWLLETPPIFVTRAAADDLDGPTLRPFFTQSAAEAYADAPLADSDVEHIASMFWPDVRLKRFVEVRPADCMPEEQIIGYTALIKGIFYSNESLSAIEEELGVSANTANSRGAWGLTAQDVSAAIAQIASHGLAGSVYGKELSTWEGMLFDLARAALPTSEKDYLVPLESFAADKPWWHVD